MGFDSLYRGIVIQNNDPLNSGRVKVFVPGVNLTQIKNWNQQTEEDQYFKVPGSNTNSALTPDILENQKDKLFWAEVMLPIIGASAPGIYHAPSDQYYIGNDSDYNFQRDNKNLAAFAQDAIQAAIRLLTAPPIPSYGKSPRTKPILNFPQSGSKFCINTGCKKNNTPTVSPFQHTSPDIAIIAGELPKTYKDTPLQLDQDPELDDNLNNSDTSINNPITSSETSVVPIPNDSVIKVNIDAIDPEIFLNDTLIPKDSPIYNTECFVTPVPTTAISFNPPIRFLETTGTPSGFIDDMHVSLTINNRVVDDREFKLQSSTDTSVTYTSGNIKVVIPKSNVNGVDIYYTNEVFNFTRIKAIQPLIKSNNRTSSESVFIKKPIMPRAPKSSGQQMISRGGGGGEIFNAIISTLLPIFMRLDAHIGGANNESRMTCNQGRNPSNDPNNVKGCNFRGNASQSHRGPMRSPDYNNDWKGMMSIPGIGAHVWVKFEGGDPNRPIVVGTFASQENYKGIYEAKPVAESKQLENDPPSDTLTTPTDGPTGPSGPTGENAADGPDSGLFPNTNADTSPTSQGSIPIEGRQTSYGYAGDPYSDTNSANGVGAFVPDSEEAKIKAGIYSDYRLREGDIAISGDIERSFRSGGIQPGQNVKVTFSDGSTHTGRWMDKTDDSLRGRIDLYSPGGAHPRDGIKVRSFEPAP